MQSLRAADGKDVAQTFGSNYLASRRQPKASGVQSDRRNWGGSHRRELDRAHPDHIGEDGDARVARPAAAAGQSLRGHLFAPTARSSPVRGQHAAVSSGAENRSLEQEQEAALEVASARPKVREFG